MRAERPSLAMKTRVRTTDAPTPMRTDGTVRRMWRGPKQTPADVVGGGEAEAKQQQRDSVCGGEAEADASPAGPADRSEPQAAQVSTTNGALPRRFEQMKPAV